MNDITALCLELGMASVRARLSETAVQERDRHIAEQDKRIADLEAELAKLREAPAPLHAVPKPEEKEHA